MAEKACKEDGFSQQVIKNSKMVNQETQILAEEEERLKELWQKILSYIKRDIAYVYTDLVRKELSEIKEEAKKVEDFLKTLRYRAYTNDQERFKLEIEHLELLIKYIEKLDKTKPNEFIKHVHAEMMQVISDLEREKAEGRGAHVWERRRLLEEWGFKLGVTINLEKRLVDEWETTLKIKNAAEPNFLRGLFIVGLPRCRDLVERDGLLKTGMSLIKIAKKSKLDELFDFFWYGLPKDEEVKKIKDLVAYGNDLLKKINILLPLSSGKITRYTIELATVCELAHKARLYVKLFEIWNQKFLRNLSDEETTRKRRSDFHELIIKLTDLNSNRITIRPIKEISELMEAFTELFEFIYTLPLDITNNQEFNRYKNDAIRVGLDSHDPNGTQIMLHLFKASINSVDRNILYRFLDSVAIYGRHHNLSKESIKSFQEKLLPAMANSSHNVEILVRGSNIWAMGRGEFGVGDFTVHCYATCISSPNLNSLLMVAKEIPTTDISRLEQNRKDALSLAGVFGILRDFIHDQRPLVHEFLKAMVEYYDTAQKDKLQSLIPLATYFNSDERKNMLFERANYEREVVESVNGQNAPTKAINVLRRLVFNTTLTTDYFITTSDNLLNEKMRALEARLNEGNLEDLLDYVNQKLIDMMKRKEVGIEPSLVLDLIWIDQKAFRLLQKMNYETQVVSYKMKWFWFILKFQELTNSPTDFNEHEFDSFIQHITNLPFDKAYKAIGARIMNNINVLARKHKSMGRGHITGALWSGNLTHELIGLIDFKPATTRYGEKHRVERQIPLWMRNTGD